MTKVFISYRHHDADAFADAVYDEFERRLGSESVFLDVRGLKYGEHFPNALRERIRQTSVVLVLVGAQWIDSRDRDGVRRLEREDDWVRLELREAIRQGKRVIPILVRGGRMPLREELPPDIQDFAELHAFSLTHQWLDLPRLGGLVEGKLSVAEPVVLMAMAASYAFAERSAQRAKSQPFSSGDSDLSAIAVFASYYYQGVGTATYYGVLLFGALVALRTRVGWRLEEMLRIALCAAGGVAVGFITSKAVLGANSSKLGVAAMLAFWFLGLSVGTLFGLRHFAPVKPLPLSAAGRLCIGIGLAAFAGSLLQSHLSQFLRNSVSDQMTFSRAAFWWPVVLAGTLLWLYRADGKGRVTAADLWSVLLPVFVAMVLADVIAIATAYVPFAANKAEVMKAIDDKQSQDNALFFAMAAGIAAWRINRVLRDRSDRTRSEGGSIREANTGQ